MPTRKIDFGALRAQLSFTAVLAHYKFEATKKDGDQWQGYCLLPRHGYSLFQHKERSPAFSVNIGRGIYHCFGCGEKGNVLEFVIRMEGFDSEDGEQFRQGAMRAEDLFLRGTGKAGMVKVATSQPPAATSVPVHEATKPDTPVVVNAPLDFVLQNLEPAHPYLRQRGFSSETIAHFGLGFARRGLMKNRIAIPIKNRDGALVGYAGRVVDDAAISQDNPKYLFPGDRKRDGKPFGFRPSELLYYPDELRACTSKYLFLVKGFPSVWWFWQHGTRAVAAVMGQSLSASQVKLVRDLTIHNARIVVVTGNSSSSSLAESAVTLLSPYRFVRSLRLDDVRQPTDVSADNVALMRNTLLA